MLFGEDASQVRCGNIPQVMAALRNATLTLLRTSGNTEITSALRHFPANPKIVGTFYILWCILKMLCPVKHTPELQTQFSHCIPGE